MYTHTLIFRLGDGGQFINCIFGVDSKGKLAYKITGSSDPLSLETHEEFVNYMKTLQTLYTKYNGLPIVMVKQDSYSEPSYTITKK